MKKVWRDTRTANGCCCSYGLEDIDGRGVCCIHHLGCPNAGTDIVDPVDLRKHPGPKEPAFILQREQSGGILTIHFNRADAEKLLASLQEQLTELPDGNWFMLNWQLIDEDLDTLGVM